MAKKPLGDALPYQFILVGRIIKKIRADEVKIIKLNSRQIKDFVIQQWEVLKNEKKDNIDKIGLSGEQEKEIISRVTRALRKLKKKQEKIKKS